MNSATNSHHIDYDKMLNDARRHVYGDSVDNYASLHDVLDAAFARAAKGKGKERHGSTGERFEDQLIMLIERLQLGFQRGQAVKKIVESVTMEKAGNVEGAIKENLDAIVYLASKVLELQSRK